jgi:hypothetical protein
MVGFGQFSELEQERVTHIARTKLIGATFSIVATGLLIASACMYVRAIARSHAHNWEPLILPVSLHPGMIRTPDIQIDRNGEYDIVLELEEKYDIRTMECLLGINISTAGNPSRCNQTPSLVDISWTLFEGDKVISEGDSNDDRSFIWGSTVERTLGRFSGQKGHRYSLVLRIRQDGSELNTASPKIKVEVPRGISKDYSVGIYIEKVVAIGFGVVGFLVLILTFPFVSRRLPRNGSIGVHD